MEANAAPALPFNVSVTRLRLRRWWFVPRFAIHTRRIRRQLLGSRGLAGGMFAVELPLTFWTVSIWADEQSMRAFRNGGEHVKSMRHLLDWCDEASYVHWSQDGASLPTAAEIFARLRDEGKLSKVRHPSPCHASGAKVGRSAPKLAGRLSPGRSSHDCVSQ